MKRGKMSRADLLELACLAATTMETCLLALSGAELGRTAFVEVLARAERARLDVGDKLAAVKRRLGDP